MVLDKGVGKYRGFALLAISMTGQCECRPLNDILHKLTITTQA